MKKCYRCGSDEHLEIATVIIENGVYKTYRKHSIFARRLAIGQQIAGLETKLMAREDAFDVAVIVIYHSMQQ